MSQVSEAQVKKYLKWDPLIDGIESALAEYSRKSVIQPDRIVMGVPERGAFLAMPGYQPSTGLLGCKLVTSFPGNASLGKPTILGNIFLFDGNTGQLNWIIEGTEITGWRTAAASVVATKHMHRGEKKILAIMGAGTQGKTHAMALMHAFKFQKVHIWNRTYEKAQALCEALGDSSVYVPFRSGQDAVKNADVICTATYSSTPVVQRSWVKSGAHINAIGAGLTHHSELDPELYQNSIIVVDSLSNAHKELKGLFDSNAVIWGEIGELINSPGSLPRSQPITVFHSMGMAIEDIVAANLIATSAQADDHPKNS